ncbi:hypothetical protein ASPACDRAFT_1859870 [Aspergillus aculeatus ATCC 16872]|uniref:Zn(2)-C6 fungal-type domain-containing protein n=1 Tax=Aspergillus aculeatus (strain ATCC 16872 / CBS 172.66 / WB 5094) TaxID=690307 RepID=A0A1L9WHI2_ASPA1|nr:uncharacterized protein ASPACDRAFT_1859870 [Aspergillus aculeatus ATCC 16872]OJJ95613.1 hypothetical protein ASPACDRAFT_1859870 [Aspergillus aculeatus ATCC 16872]
MAADEADQPEFGKDKSLACQSCRRKKTKCDREQPCAQCTRFNTICLYDDCRSKPGLRAGAVERLQQRVDTLENMFLGQGLLWQKMWSAMVNGVSPNIPPPTQNGIESAGITASLQHLSEEVKQRLLQEAAGTADPDGTQMRSLGLELRTGGREHERREANDKEEQNEERNSMSHQKPPEPRPEKRRKLHLDAPRKQQATETVDDLSASQPSAQGLLPHAVMMELVEFHFANVHPWIPILHVRRFREQLYSPDGWHKALPILHAILATSIRFTSHPAAGSLQSKGEMAAASRQRVILNSMESFSVENLQALVIIAFDIIGSGRGPSAWSVVGSMTRTVEQLQLSVEDRDDDEGRTAKGEYLIKRMVFLKPAQHWWQTEERRRVFWTVFLMDRFCSVSTGWNLSLTSADVRRRLPCEGALWQREQEQTTPFFGIANHFSHGASGSILNDSKHPGQDSIGGFAYAIEATESLSLVVHFFLHNALDIEDVQTTKKWLLRFKELDLRLVQWKLLLPQKWQSAAVLNVDGIMDPNLTLAHFTHNTALILLHQSMAYPPAHWKDCPVRLPSATSLETCIEAASEIVMLGSLFLQHSSILANPQFSFCLFIAGRMLLVHSQHARLPVSDQLDSIVGSLLEISRRWAGPGASDHQNLASVFGERLMKARQFMCCNATSPSTPLDIRQAAYSESVDCAEASLVDVRDRCGNGVGTSTGSLSHAPQSSSAEPHTHWMSIETHSLLGGLGEQNRVANHISPSDFFNDTLSLAFPPLPQSLQVQYDPLAEMPMVDPSCLSKEAPLPIPARPASESSQFWDHNPH